MVEAAQEMTEPDLATAETLQDTMEPDLTAVEKILDMTEPDLSMAETLLDTMEPIPLATSEASASERPPDEASSRPLGGGTKGLREEALKTSG